MKTINTRIQVTEEEIAFAKEISIERHRRNQESSNSNAKIDPNTNDIAVMVEGYCGEIIFSKIFGTVLDKSTEPRKSVNDNGDTVYEGKNIDIKTTKYSAGGSLAAPRWTKSNVDAYALIVGQSTEYDGHFVFRGFMTKKDLIKPERLGTLGHGDTYLAESHELKEFNDLDFN